MSYKRREIKQCWCRLAETGLSSGVSCSPLFLSFLLDVFIAPSVSIPFCPEYYISRASIMNNSSFFLSLTFCML